KGTQAAITITAAAPARFGVSGFPSPATAGIAGTFTVVAQDAFGNRSSSYPGTVHFTSTDALAVLPANYTFTAADGGMHTFTNGAPLFTAGSRTITATDTVTSSQTGAQTVAVAAAAAASMTLAGFANPTVAGVVHTITGTLFDAFGNVATGYRGAV